MDKKNEDKESFSDITPKKRSTLPKEFWDFVKHNKKWWLIPILLLLVLFSTLTFLGGTAIAPFIYTLF